MLYFWPTVRAPLRCCVVCLSVTFCIVAKRHILAKNCLKEQIVLPPETTPRYQFGPPIHPQRGIIMDKVVYFACFRKAVCDYSYVVILYFLVT